jgi:hypothetical protein
MKLLACLRAIAQIVQALPPGKSSTSPRLEEAFSRRLELSSTREDVAALMEHILEEKIRLTVAEQIYKQRRLPKYFIDRLVDEAFKGKRETNLPFIAADAVPEGVRPRGVRDLVKSELKRMGFRVTNGEGCVLRVRW